MAWNMKNRKDETGIAESIVDRAKKRLLKSTPIGSDGHWILPGLEEFGDAYSEYRLHTDRQGTWYCSCYDHYFGESRKEQVCSHAVACALFSNLPCQRTLPLKEELRQEEPKQKKPKRPTPDRPCDIDGIPDDYTRWRPGQRETVDWLVEQLKDRKDGNSIAIDVPTGGGKSVEAIAAAKLTDKKAIIVVSTKQLQQQYADSFPDAVVIQGRENYPCPRFSGTELTAASCTHSKHSPCPKLNQCPYKIQKRRALAADLVVVNYAFFLNEANYVGGFSGWPLVIFDEADLAESELMKHVSVTLTRHQLEQCEIEPPEFKTKPEAWVRWAQ